MEVGVDPYSHPSLRFEVAQISEEEEAVACRLVLRTISRCNLDSSLFHFVVADAGTDGCCTSGVHPASFQTGWTAGLEQAVWAASFLSKPSARRQRVTQTGQQPEPNATE